MHSTNSLQEPPIDISWTNRIAKAAQKVPALDLLISCAITLPISSTVGLEPTYHDGAIFMYIGEMWRRGIVPYLGLFDNKPPGIFILTAIASATRYPLWALAVINFLFVMCGVLAIKRTLQAFETPAQTVFFGTVATALLVNLRFYGAGALPEDYMWAPAAASMLAFAYAIQSGKLRFVFLAGLCSGVACMFKPFALSVFMAQVVFLLLTQAPRIRVVLRSISANIAGALTAWAPISIYFALKGGLKQMLDASFFYNLHYGVASQPKPLALLSSLAETLLPLSTTLGCILFGLLALRRHAWRVSSGRSALWCLTLLWFGFSLALVLLAGRGYHHYFMSITPPSALAAALVVWSVEEYETAPGLRFALCALILSPVVMAEVPGFVTALHDYAAAASHEHQVIPVEVAAAELHQIAQPSSTVFVWGFEPYIFSSTHLRSAFRFPTSQYIYDSPRAYDEVGREVLADMQTAPPDYVVLTPWGFSMNWPHQSDVVQARFMTILQKSYTKFWDKDSFSLYKHN